MDAVHKVVDAASHAIWGTPPDEHEEQSEEPLSGVQGKGSATDPYDAGNREVQPEAPSTEASTATQTPAFLEQAPILSGPNKGEGPTTNLPSQVGEQRTPNLSQSALDGESSKEIGSKGLSSNAAAPTAATAAVATAGEDEPVNKVIKDALKESKKPAQKEVDGLEKGVDGVPSKEQQDVSNITNGGGRSSTSTSKTDDSKEAQQTNGKQHNGRFARMKSKLGRVAKGGNHSHDNTK